MCALRSGEIEPAVECGAAGSVEKDHEGEGDEGKDVLGAVVPLADADEEERDRHVDGDHEGGEAGEEADDEKEATEKLGERGDVAEPVGQAKRGDVVGEVVDASEQIATVQSAERGDLAPAVDKH